MPDFNEYRVTASARLRLWDSLRDAAAFNRKLGDVLRKHADAVVMTPPRLQRQHNPPEIPIHAVLDKVISRGNPTIVEHRWEHRHLDTTAAVHVETTPYANNELVGRRLVKSFSVRSGRELLEAAEALWLLPYDDADRPTDDLDTAADEMGPLPYDADLPTDRLADDLAEISSRYEDRLYAVAQCALKPAAFPWLRRQAWIYDLVDHDHERLTKHQRDNLESHRDSQVDFALAYGNIRLVVEVDGCDHLEPAQKREDDRRDRLLNNGGWHVIRITNAEIDELERQGFNPFDHLLARLELQSQLTPAQATQLRDDGTRRTVRELVAQSAPHAAALELVIKPAVIHRAMRALLHVLHTHHAADKPLKVLLIDEDLNAGGEAWRQLKTLWEAIHRMAPSEAPPKLDLHYYSDGESHDHDYDLVIDHAVFLSPDQAGAVESRLPADLRERTIRIRPAHGDRNNPSLLRAPPIQYAAEDGGWADSLRYLLRLIFGKKELRDGQRAAITRLLRRQDTITLLPTGAGKSLIYQLAGLLLNGTTIVVEPINSLMQDQVKNLRQYGIDRLGEVNSTIEREENAATLRRLGDGRLCFLYITPERLQNRTFREELRQATVRYGTPLAVIDEAHCVSEWGHEFRPAYLRLAGNLRRNLDLAGRTPTLGAFTGTASYAVLADMRKSLSVQDTTAEIRPDSFDRKELTYQVDSVGNDGRLGQLKRARVEILDDAERRGDNSPAGIVFLRRVDKRHGVINVAAELGHENYYAGRRPEEFPPGKNWNAYKRDVQGKFTSGAIREIVATKGFGMGIDKPDVRYTLHYDMPSSIEAFYQQAGRAGRDRQPAQCQLLYSHQNWSRAQRIIANPDHEKAMQQLNNVKPWHRGDALGQLWFILSNYPSIERDVTDTMSLLDKYLHTPLAELGAAETAEVSVPWRSKADQSSKEKALHKLGVLGIVTDYTIDYRLKHFEIEFTKLTREQLYRRLVEHVASALPIAAAEGECKTILEAEEPTERAVETLIQFTYDHLAAQRKEAVRNMAELCQGFKDSDSFRDGILAYLEWSEVFSDELDQWRTEDKGGEDIKKVLDKADTPDRRRQLVGTVRRVRESAPEHLGLLALSVCARAVCEAMTDQSVLEELALLCAQPGRDNRIEPEVAALSEVAQARDEATTGRAAAILVARRPTAAYSRAILASPAGAVPSVQAVVSAAALQRLTRLAHTLSFVESESD